MTKKTFNQAMCYIDDDLVEKHLTEKEINKNIKPKIKRLNRIKWYVAACIVFTILIAVPSMIIPVIDNLTGYNSPEDDLYERTHTTIKTYDELVKIIGSDTLLENFDFSSIDNYSFTINHKPNDINNYKSVSFVIDMPDNSFGVGIYFPPYDEKETDFCVSGDIKTINGVNVEIDKQQTDSYLYSYVAEFEYNHNKYVVRGTGNTKEAVFWDMLYILLEK